EAAWRAVPVDAQQLARHRVQKLPTNHPHARAVVDCGAPIVGIEIVTVDVETLQSLGPDSVGEIWVRGDCVASGYWQQAEASAQTFGARLADGSGAWPRTGDLGFVDEDGHVFITGRLKDLIIVRGRNVYPQDVEWSAQAVDA